MKNYLNDFYGEFDYPLEARDALNAAYLAIESDEKALELLNKILDGYTATRTVDNSELIPTCNEIAELAGVSEMTVKLLALICLSRPLRAYYAEKGLEDALWYSAMSDLKWKLIECHLVKGVWGTFVADCGWFSRWYDITRFALGRLQFEIIKFNREYEKDGKRLTPDSKVINVHIPRTGTPLNHDEILASYEQAKKMFADEFTDAPMAFRCSSWLLFPEHRKILHEKSNILKFMSDFDIFAEDYYPEGKNDTYWRIFDCPLETPLKELPEDSFLKRAYKKHLLEGGRLGYGVGVFFA